LPSASNNKSIAARFGNPLCRILIRGRGCALAGSSCARRRTTEKPDELAPLHLSSSDAFKADEVLIAKCLADLRLATLGKWAPEYVYVESLGRDLERPGSAKLSQIAELARTGGLRLPPTLLSSDRA
jgi:hypothetical protein